MDPSETLETTPSESLPPFPPHRRRHLHSDTYFTICRFLSIANKIIDGGNNAFGRTTETRIDAGRASNELERATEVCGDAYGTSDMESEIFSTNGNASCSKVMNVVESVHEDRMETEDFNDVKEINKELGQEAVFEIVSSLEETYPESCVVSLNMIDESQYSFVGSLLKDSEIVRNTDVDKEDQSCKLTESFHVSLDVGEPAKSPVLDGNEEVKSSVMGSSELHQDLENSLGKFDWANSPLCVAVDEQIEEGEISGDFVMDDELNDFLYEEEQTSGPIVNTGKRTNQNQIGTSELENKYDKVFGITVDEVGKGVESNLRESNVSEINMKSETVVSETVEAKLVHGYETVREIVSYQNLIDIATTYQGGITTDKDAGVERKRKRGPLTQEKKAKKKKKERIKRAEKNRQLGVKRLKIQPVLKPKTINYCRHYLKGRCQEGDKCKFSHDITPLTKSKPCCHFALGAGNCMKGDTCPYDHQLSKYPCNNIISYGVCKRDTKCLFSHEVQAAEGSLSSVSASKSEVKLSSLSCVTNLEKKMSPHNSSNQKAAFKTGSSGVSSSFRSAEQKIAEIRLRAAASAPKNGISNLLFGKSPLGNESKLIQAGTSSKVNGILKVNLPVVNNTDNMVSNSKEIFKVPGHNEPQGLSCLSFGKDLTHDMHMNNDKQATCPLKQAESLKSISHTSENKRGLLSNLRETSERTPSMPPRGINFLSFSKAPGSNSSNMTIASPTVDSEGKMGPKLTVELGKGTPSSSLTALLSNGTSSAQKALQSTLAFASKYESGIKIDHPISH